MEEKSVTLYFLPCLYRPITLRYRTVMVGYFDSKNISKKIEKVAKILDRIFRYFCKIIAKIFA